MPINQFHSEAFDDGTLLKLQIFRGYIREWLPVFLTKKTFPAVHIYDFFAGPGADGAGNPGSPLVILDELEQFLASGKTAVAPDLSIVLHFNDSDCEKMAQLEQIVRQRGGRLPCSVKFSCADFRQAFLDNLPSIQNGYSANLVIMDQYGIKEVNRDIFATLMACSTTDILFFISSSFIRRFINDESVQQHFGIPEAEIRAVSAKEVHRYICREFYQKLVPVDQKYHVAPFSIEKDGGSNIYGIIFGTSNLLGLDKFLRVCWNQDKVTGEANYNIDDDIVRDGQGALFEEFGVVKKRNKFERELVAFIKQHEPDNRELYRFVLENGFLPAHANELLRTMQQHGDLSVVVLESGQKARANSFYLGWDAYKTGQGWVRFTLKGASDVL